MNWYVYRGEDDKPIRWDNAWFNTSTPFNTDKLYHLDDDHPALKHADFEQLPDGRLPENFAEIVPICNKLLEWIREVDKPTVGVHISNPQDYIFDYLDKLCHKIAMLPSSDADAKGLPPNLENVGSWHLKVQVSFIARLREWAVAAGELPPSGNDPQAEDPSAYVEATPLSVGDFDKYTDFKKWLDKQGSNIRHHQKGQRRMVHAGDYKRVKKAEDAKAFAALDAPLQAAEGLMTGAAERTAQLREKKQRAK